MLISKRMAETSSAAANEAISLYCGRGILCKTGCRNFISAANPYKRKEERAVWYAVTVRMFEAATFMARS